MPSAEPTILVCAPGCIRPDANYEPGAFTAGTYTTKYFLGHALTITVPAGWSGGEDNRRELNLGPSGQDDHGIKFWEDGKPPAKNSVLPAPGVPDTAAGVLAWLQANKNLGVSMPASGMIGKFPATVVDIGIAAGAANEDPGGCPVKVCVNLMTWTDFPDGPEYGFGVPKVVRLYLADITYGGTPHLLMALVDGRDRADLEAFLPLAIPIIASATAPVSPG
jgi:hypothetical protein